jgi:hypothetical protein
MTALISAELLRLRTARSTLYGTLGGLTLIALLAAIPLLDAGSRPSEAGHVLGNLRGSVEPIVFSIGIASAAAVGAAFKLGTVTMTYLAHPRRERVTGAHIVVWAGYCGLFAAVASAVVVALEVAAAHAAHIDAGLSAGEVARIICGAAFGGSVLGSAGVLAATVTRQATIAVAAVVGWNIIETLVAGGFDGSGRYLPLNLAGSVMGFNHGMPAFPAMGLLIAYLAAFALAVRTWALPRDLT